MDSAKSLQTVSENKMNLELTYDHARDVHILWIKDIPHEFSRDDIQRLICLLAVMED